jgi:hypothetical protein
MNLKHPLLIQLVEESLDQILEIRKMILHREIVHYSILKNLLKNQTFKIKNKKIKLESWNKKRINNHFLKLR